jgi:hypothetical protein
MHGSLPFVESNLAVLASTMKRVITVLAQDIWHSHPRPANARKCPPRISKSNAKSKHFKKSHHNAIRMARTRANEKSFANPRQSW